MLVWPVCLPSVRSCLPWLAGCHGGLPLWKHSNGSKVRSTGLQDIRWRLPKPSRTCPIQFPLEAVTSATNSVRAVMDKRKTLAFESIPERDWCVQATQVALHVCCTIDLNVVNGRGWENGFLQPHQKTSSSSRRMLQVGKKDIWGKLGT